MKTSTQKFGIACATALLAGTSGFAMSNDSTCVPRYTQAYGLIGPGVSWVSLARVNNSLAGQGISSFREYTPTLSIGGHKEMGRMILESGVTGLFWKDHVDSALRTSMWMGNVMWNTGVNVLPSGMPVIAFPYAGIGVGVNGIQIRNDRKSLSDILTTEEPNSMFWQAAFLLNLGAGADLRMTNADKTKGAVIGLRGGFTFDPFDKSRWYSDGVHVTGLSAVNQSGVYVRLVLGGWGKDERHHCGGMMTSQ